MIFERYSSGQYLRREMFGTIEMAPQWVPTWWSMHRADISLIAWGWAVGWLSHLVMNWPSIP